MTQDDGHIFCREDQILDETKSFMDLFMTTYKDFGFEDVKLKVATRPDQRAGTDETWDKAETALIDAISQLGYEYALAEGEGAFYGPKLEFHVRDAIGRSWQCATLQVDFIMPQRLDATYIGSDGQKHYPVMLHRAVYGSFERFAGMLIEGYAGKLPLWVAPVQAVRRHHHERGRRVRAGDIQTIDGGGDQSRSGYPFREDQSQDPRA